MAGDAADVVVDALLEEERRGPRRRRHRVRRAAHLAAPVRRRVHGQHVVCARFVVENCMHIYIYVQRADGSVVRTMSDIFLFFTEREV